MLCVSSKAPYCCAGGRIQASIQTAASRSSSTAVSIMCWADALPLALLSSSGLQEQQKGEEGEECKKHELKFKSRLVLEAWLHPALHPNPVGNPPPPRTGDVLPPNPDIFQPLFSSCPVLISLP